MNFITNHKWVIIFSILGAIAGYLYYAFVGCKSGTCLITSKPINSTMYGLIVGGLIGFELKTKKKPKQND